MHKTSVNKTQQDRTLYFKRVDKLLNKLGTKAYGNNTVNSIVNKYNPRKKVYQTIHHTKAKKHTHIKSSKPVHIPNRLINTKIAFILTNMYKKNHYTFTYHHNDEVLSASHLGNSFVVFRILLSIKFIKVNKNEHHHITASLTNLGKSYVKKYLKNLANSHYSYHAYHRKEMANQDRPITLLYVGSIGLLILSIILANLDLSFLVFIAIISGLSVAFFGIYFLIYLNLNHTDSIDKLINKASRKSFEKFAKHNQIRIPNAEFRYENHLQSIDQFLFNGRRTKAN